MCVFRSSASPGPFCPQRPQHNQASPASPVQKAVTRREAVRSPVCTFEGTGGHLKPPMPREMDTSDSKGEGGHQPCLQRPRTPIASRQCQPLTQGDVHRFYVSEPQWLVTLCMRRAGPRRYLMNPRKRGILIISPYWDKRDAAPHCHQMQAETVRGSTVAAPLSGGPQAGHRNPRGQAGCP